MPRPKVTLIAAMTKNNVIGQAHRIPWKVKGEQEFFRKVTMGHWCIVGRKTFESLPRLDGRKFAVITSKPQKPSKDVMYFSSPREALRELGAFTDHVMVIGGGQIYEEMISEADRVILSVLIMYAPADESTIFFPKHLPDDLKCVHKEHVKSNVDYTIKVWEKESL